MGNRVPVRPGEGNHPSLHFIFGDFAEFEQTETIYKWAVNGDIKSKEKKSYCFSTVFKYVIINCQRK